MYSNKFAKSITVYRAAFLHRKQIILHCQSIVVVHLVINHNYLLKVLYLCVVFLLALPQMFPQWIVKRSGCIGKYRNAYRQNNNAPCENRGINRQIKWH